MFFRFFKKGMQFFPDLIIWIKLNKTFEAGLYCGSPLIIRIIFIRNSQDILCFRQSVSSILCLLWWVDQQGQEDFKHFEVQLDQLRYTSPDPYVHPYFPISYILK
jgi:hypothetical protein